jgi:NAD(P)-dependent dehydrogenase (short-subunit alcohol dehydrogenase family)
MRGCADPRACGFAARQECIAAGGAGAEGRVLVKPLDIGRFAESNDFKDVAAEVAKHWGGVIDVIVQNAGGRGCMGPPAVG